MPADSQRGGRSTHPRATIWISRRQVAVWVGHRHVGLRSGAMREYYSERNRLGWKIKYLPFGWRAFYRNEAPR